MPYFVIFLDNHVNAIHKRLPFALSCTHAYKVNVTDTHDKLISLHKLHLVAYLFVGEKRSLPYVNTLAKHHISAQPGDENACLS